jgi:nucleoside-diphosphate-sugar epimerase
MVNSAVSGIKAVLKGCKQYKVKKLIVTSSLSTVMGTNFKGSLGNQYNEEDFALGQPN